MKLHTIFTSTYLTYVVNSKLEHQDKRVRINSSVLWTEKLNLKYWIFKKLNLFALIFFFWKFNSLFHKFRNTKFVFSSLPVPEITFTFSTSHPSAISMVVWRAGPEEPGLLETLNKANKAVSKHYDRLIYRQKVGIVDADKYLSTVFDSQLKFDVNAELIAKRSQQGIHLMEKLNSFYLFFFFSVLLLKAFEHFALPAGCLWKTRAD